VDGIGKGLCIGHFLFEPWRLLLAFARKNTFSRKGDAIWEEVAWESSTPERAIGLEETLGIWTFDDSF